MAGSLRVSQRWVLVHVLCVPEVTTGHEHSCQCYTENAAKAWLRDGWLGNTTQQRTATINPNDSQQEPLTDQTLDSTATSTHRSAQPAAAGGMWPHMASAGGGCRFLRLTSGRPVVGGRDKS